MHQLRHQHTSPRTTNGGRRNPLWSKAVTLHLKTGDVVALPVQYDKHGLGQGAVGRLVVSRNAQGEMQSREMQFIGSHTYALRNNFQLRGSDFSGAVLEKDWNGNFLSGVAVKDGKITGTLSNDTSNAGGRVGSRSCYILEIIYYVRVTSEGYDGHWQFNNKDSYQVCVDSDGGRDIDTMTPIGNLGGGGTGGNGGGVGGTGGVFEPAPVIDDGGTPITIVLPRIIDELKSPCLKDVLRTLQNKGFKADVNRTLNKVFGISDDVDIKFTENPNLPVDVDGKVVPGGLGYNRLTKKVYGEVVVEINSTALANATKEYVAATYLHEAIHAYINYRNTFVELDGHPEDKIKDLQHDVMAVSYVTALKAAILEVYPNYPPAWAEAIAWGGLGSTASWSVMNSAAKQEIINKNQAEKGAVVSPLGPVGTQCP